MNNTNQLSKEEKDKLTLQYLEEGLTIKQIAAKLNETRDQTWGRIRRLRKYKSASSSTENQGLLEDFHATHQELARLFKTLNDLMERNMRLLRKRKPPEGVEPQKVEKALMGQIDIAQRLLSRVTEVQSKIYEVMDIERFRRTVLQAFAKLPAEYRNMLLTELQAEVYKVSDWNNAKEKSGKASFNAVGVNRGAAILRPPATDITSNHPSNN